MTLSDTADGSESELEVSGLFIAIGHDPRSELVVGQVQLDAEGYVMTDGKSTRTNLPGVFACGDLVDHIYRQAVTAAGTGCQAALDAERYLADLDDAGDAMAGGRRGAADRRHELTDCQRPAADEFTSIS